MFFLAVLLTAQHLRCSGYSHNLMTELVFAALNLLIAFCFFLVWTIWIGGCHQKLRDDEVFKEFDVTPGAGWTLGFLIFVFSIVGGVIEFLFAESLRPSPSKARPRASTQDDDIKKDEEKNEADATQSGGGVPGAPVAVEVVVSDPAQQIDNKNNNNYPQLEQPSKGEDQGIALGAAGASVAQAQQGDDGAVLV
mmetsp:Transcript_14205/g.19744  ORF Transcript_14205/g.19744 Transcript_14205/m.19744 type:complete len:194 (+) Transcript_14205:421-1002(+)